MMTLPIGTAEERELIERLKVEARQEGAACKMLADAKTARQTDREDAWTDAGYSWITAEQTTRWKAATALQSRIAEVEALLERVARIEGALHKRMHIYRTKRDAADPLADDTYNRHDAFALVVEAFDIFETESGIRASLTQGGE